MQEFFYQNTLFGIALAITITIGAISNPLFAVMIYNCKDRNKLIWLLILIINAIALAYLLGYSIFKVGFGLADLQFLLITVGIYIFPAVMLEKHMSRKG